MNVPSRRRLVAFAFVIVGGVALFLAFYRAEPVYNGKPLSAWADQWGSNHWRVPSTTESKRADQEAEAAIRAIGDKLRTIVPRSWHARLQVDERASKLKVTEVKVTGAHGLAALGTNGGAAVPGLMELARAEARRNPPDHHGGYLPVWTLGYLGGAAERAVPLLVECLTNTYDRIRLDAAQSLGMIGRRPEIVVPALVTFFHAHKSANVAEECYSALESLGQFGTNASAATLFFVSLLKDPEPVFRQEATNWLLYINPAVGEELGVQFPWKALKPGSSQGK